VADPTYRDRVTDTATQAPEQQAPPSTRVLDAAIGVLAAAFGVAVGTLLAAFMGPQFAPIEVVSSTAIDIPPAEVKEWATSTFGTATKPIVVAVVIATVVVVSAWAGIRSRRRPAFGAQVMIIAGVVGAIAALLRPVDSVLAPIPALAAGLAAAIAIMLMMRLSSRQVVTITDDVTSEPHLVVDRRGVLLGMGGVAIVGAAAFASARWITTQSSAVASRLSTLLPAPAEALPALPAGVQAPVPNMTPFVTPSADFYRIDTAVITPQVEAKDWSLTFDGMVRRPYTITYADLLEMPMVERDVTIMCVSNPIGGDLIGNARWLGTPLMPLLERAGIESGADQLLSTSVDGWTCSTPLDGLAEAEPLLVIGMNGEPLPIDHGFPVRMIVPGLYGFISATKWVTRIQATTYAAEPAYWTVRGWATDAPVLTGSRIDLPKGDVNAGANVIAGISWAMAGDGVSRVEVSVDDGEWREANLAEQPTPRTWRQWWIDWDAAPGRHIIAVRATNGLGETQTSEERDVIPAGATGYDRLVVDVV